MIHRIKLPLIVALLLAHCPAATLAQNAQPQALKPVVQPLSECFGYNPLPGQTQPAFMMPQQAPMQAPSGLSNQQGDPSQMQQALMQPGQKPGWNSDDYLTGVGSRRVPVGQGGQYGQFNDPATTGIPLGNYQSPYNTGYFVGKATPADAQRLEKWVRVGPGQAAEDPAWAKAKVPIRHFKDNQEHFGNDDPYGFFDH